MFAHLLLAFPFLFFFYPFSLSLALYHCVTCMDITHFGFFKNHKLWAKYYPNLSFRAFKQSMDVKWPLAVNFYHFSFKSVSQSVRQSGDQSVRWAGSQSVDITNFAFFKNHKLWAKYYPNLSFRAFKQSMDVKWPLAVNFYHFSFKSVSQSVRQSGDQSVRWAGSQSVDITNFAFFKNHKLWAKYYPNLSFRAFKQSMDVKWPLAVNFYHFSFKSVSQSVRQSGDQSVRWSVSQVSRQSVSQSVRQAGRQAISQSDSKSVSQLVRQSVSQAGSQSVSLSVSQAGREAGRLSVSQSVSQSAVSQSVSHLASQSVSLPVSYSASLSMSLPICQSVSCYVNYWTRQLIILQVIDLVSWGQHILRVVSNLTK